MKSIKFNVYGRQVLISQKGHGWTAWYVGPEGKKRPAPDITVPASIPESGMTLYLGDLCHEWATEQHPDVRRLD